MGKAVRGGGSQSAGYSGNDVATRATSCVRVGLGRPHRCGSPR